jgi:hypothetical protein
MDRMAHVTCRLARCRTGPRHAAGPARVASLPIHRDCLVAFGGYGKLGHTRGYGKLVVALDD